LLYLGSYSSLYKILALEPHAASAAAGGGHFAIEE
jgi:hypothetical protein